MKIWWRTLGLVSKKERKKDAILHCLLFGVPIRQKASEKDKNW